MKKYIIPIIIFLIAITLISICVCNSRMGGAVKVKYFHSPNCPHCRNFYPVWDNFVNSSQGKADFEKIDCTTNPDLCANIRGVPYVVFIIKEKEVVYEGQRDVQSLNLFLDKVKSS